MRFSVAVEPGSESTAWGVTVPALPGCFAAGDTFEEALEQAREAIELHIDALLEDGKTLPDDVPMEAVVANEDYRGWVFAVIDIPAERLGDRIERVNMSIPRRVLRLIDRRAEELGISRSALVTELAVRAVAGQPLPTPRARAGSAGKGAEKPKSLAELGALLG